MGYLLHKCLQTTERHTQAISVVLRRPIIISSDLALEVPDAALLAGSRFGSWGFVSWVVSGCSCGLPDHNKVVSLQGLVLFLCIKMAPWADTAGKVSGDQTLNIFTQTHKTKKSSWKVSLITLRFHHRYMKIVGCMNIALITRVEFSTKNINFVCSDYNCNTCMDVFSQ